MKLQLAIDFGATSTYVCLISDGRQRLVHFQTESGESAEAYPTLCAAPRAGGGSELEFGFAARARLADAGWDVRRDLKRSLTRDELEAHFQVGAATPTLLAAITQFFQALIATLRESSSLTAAQRRADFQVAFAVPANTHSTWRFLTGEALRGAGFELSLTLDEPSASALDQLDRSSKESASFFVYDLGGGTCDLSWLRREDGETELVASVARWDIGGADFDLRLLELALTAAERDKLSAGSIARLLELAREQKEGLTSQRRKIWLDIGACLSEEERDGLGFVEDETRVVIVRDFYQAIEPLIEESLTLFDMLTEKHPEALEESGHSQPIYLVGGGSALPLVSRKIRERLGRRVQRVTSPRGSVAYGLAGALTRAEERRNSVTHSRPTLGRIFGVFRDWNAGQSAAFDPIFSADEPLNEKREVTRRYRPRHEEGVLRFIDCAQVNDGIPEGELRHLPPFSIPYRSDEETLSGEGPLIEEYYCLGQDGQISVRVENIEQGREIASTSFSI